MDSGAGDAYSAEQLREALRALRSLLSKSEKAADKLRPGSAQDTLIRRRNAGLIIACQLIENELGRQGLER